MTNDTEYRRKNELRLWVLSAAIVLLMLVQIALAYHAADHSERLETLETYLTGRRPSK